MVQVLGTNCTQLLSAQWEENVVPNELLLIAHIWATGDILYGIISFEIMNKRSVYALVNGVYLRLNV